MLGGFVLPVVLSSRATLFFQMRAPLLLDRKHDDLSVADDASETSVAGAAYLVGILHQHGLEVRGRIDVEGTRVWLHHVDEEYESTGSGSRVGSTKVGSLQIGQTDQTLSNRSGAGSGRGAG